MTTLICLLFIFLLISSPSLASSTVNPNSATNPLAFSLPKLISFNVVKSFGARNDGKVDTTTAFLNAWNAACASPVPSQIYVPNGRYLLSPISFNGPCKSSILFTIDGTLIAQSAYYDDQSWIGFHDVDGLHIKGGVLDAKGQNLWNCKLVRRSCPDGATSLSLDNSRDIIVDGLWSTNSQKFHITLNACQNVNMAGLTITADADSPNTDGIHFEQSSGIQIMQSQIRTGDDCISIGPNNQNVWIEKVYCGPGHGISIGSLGRESDEGVIVRNVTVKSATFMGTDNGLRIKSFSTEVKGAVKDIYFLGATMTNVANPIIIDQNYCPSNQCPYGKGSGIQISDITYKGIHGTSSSEEIMIFDCSPLKPCYGITLQDINLSYQSETPPKCECNNCYVKVEGFIQPSKCLGNYYKAFLHLYSCKTDQNTITLTY